MPDHDVVNGTAGFYIVNGSCCCHDASNRNELIKGHCKHRLAALLYVEQLVQAETPKASKPKAKANDNGSSPRAKELESKVAELYR